jgi:hypothetical protein
MRGEGRTGWLPHVGCCMVVIETAEGEERDQSRKKYPDGTPVVERS